MANTSRKRPAPTAPTTNNNNQSNVNLPSGIDTLLAKYAKHLKPGETISIQLIKGPVSTSVDPIAARKAATKAARALASSQSSTTINNSGISSGNDTDNDTTTIQQPVGKGINAPLNFPRLAKFSETVTPPDFISGKLKDGRMYEEEVPLAKDESDEEESTAYKPMNMAEDGTDLLPDAASTNKNKKKKRRWRRHDVRPRRWVLQEKAEFFDRIRKRKQRGSADTGGDDDDEQGISNQYHGVVESNTSKYVILSVAPPSTTNPASLNNPTTAKLATEQISIQPIYGQHTFSQPYKFASLTMEEAESAIEQQRNVVTRYMMHGKLASANTSNNAESRAALASGVASVGVGQGRLNRPIGPAPKAMSRARLLGKLGGGGGGLDEDDDDVMGDVRYSSSKGSGRARKELLTTLGDGVTADDDGVLGGANDAEFGGRQRFGRVNMKTDDDDNKKKKAGKDGSGKTSTGFEAGAMEEGFYQRDVAAEYEALDYDANEQFDDDDVNVGEDEMMDDGGGYGGDFHDSGDDMLDSDDEGASDDDGFKGMATSSGLKAMLAKARGESPVTATSAAAAADNASSSMLSQDILDATVKNVTDANKPDEDKGIDAAKKTAEEKEKKSEKDKPSPSAAEKAAALGIEKDKDGKRLITLEAVRREIWLNNGAITSKRLTKKFDVTKKNPERQALFKTIVMELCTIKKDADGNKLVLKQHYAKV